MLDYPLAQRLLVAGFPVSLPNDGWPEGFAFFRQSEGESQPVLFVVPAGQTMEMVQDDLFCPSETDLLYALGDTLDRLDACGARFCAFPRESSLAFWGYSRDEALARLFLYLHPVA